MIIYIFFVFIYITISPLVPWKQCENIDFVGKVLSFEVQNCNPDACIFEKNTVISGHVEFIAQEDSQILKVSMSAKIGILRLELPGLNSDGCTYNSIHCPIVKDQKYLLNFTAKVPPIIIKMSTNARFQLLNENSDPFVCFDIPVILQKLSFFVSEP